MAKGATSGRRAWLGRRYSCRRVRLWGKEEKRKVARLSLYRLLRNYGRGPPLAPTVPARTVEDLTSAGNVLGKPTSRT